MDSGFWGLILEPEKRYTKVVDSPFHITSAVLDTSSKDAEIVGVMVEVNEAEYMIANLSVKHGVLQVPLDLSFKVGSQVAFYTTGGKQAVHLIGNIFDEDEMIDEEEEEEEEVPPTTVLPHERAKRRAEEVELAVKRARIAREEARSKLLDRRKAVAEDEETESEEDEEEDEVEEEEDEVEEEEVEVEEEDDEMEEDDESEEDDEMEEDDEKMVEQLKGQLQQNKMKKLKVKAQKTQKLETPNKQMKQTQKNEQMNQTSKKEQKLKQTPQNEQKMKSPKNEQKMKQSPKNELATPKGKKNKHEKAVNGKHTPPKIEDKSPATPKPTKVVKQGGVTCEDIIVGKGPDAKRGKMVSVYYEGRLVSNNKMFDKCNGGNGFKFRLGQGEVISGWDVGVAGMKVGGKRRIVCPPQMAYGKQGAPPTIPPNSPLTFVVELKSIS